MEEVKQQIRRYQKDQCIYWIFQAATILAWGYYFTQNQIKVKIFTEKFLPTFSIAEISLSCVILLFHIFTKSNLKFLVMYYILLFILYFIVFLNIAMIIGICSDQPEIFSQPYEGTFCVIIFTTLSMIFSLTIVNTAIKVMKLIVSLQYYRLELIRNLIQDAERSLYDNYDVDSEVIQVQKTVRVQSVDPSQLNDVYGKVCTICDEETDIEQRAVQLKCLHIFHSECIRKWLDTSTICPNCRMEVIQD